VPLHAGVLKYSWEMRTYPGDVAVTAQQPDRHIKYDADGRTGVHVLTVGPKP